MPDATELLKTIKKTAMDAVKAGKPADILFGTVTSASPLRISVEQQFELSEGQIILTENVTDYSVNMDVDGTLRNITVRNGLNTGDEVILIRKAGGQKFVVLDRAGAV